MLWTKRAHQRTIWRLFGALVIKVHLIPGISNFASLLSVMKDNFSVFLQLKPHLLWTKIAHRSGIFRHLSGWVKFHHISHVIFETTSQFFFKLCITLQCHGRQVLFNCLAETLFYFYKRNPPQCKISDFRLLR